jgi:hypothetical protein
MATVNITAIATPTGTTTTQELESLSTSKRDGRPSGNTKIAIDRRTSLVADAVDECMTKISTLKSMALHKTHKLGTCKKCRMCPGTFEKFQQKVFDKYNPKRSEIHMETALSRNKVVRKLKVTHPGT